MRRGYRGRRMRSVVWSCERRGIEMYTNLGDERVGVLKSWNVNVCVFPAFKV
jgi:hypothetical protein